MGCILTTIWQITSDMCGRIHSIVMCHNSAHDSAHDSARDNAHDSALTRCVHNTMLVLRLAINIGSMA